MMKLSKVILFFSAWFITFNAHSQIHNVHQDKERETAALILQKPVNDRRIQNREHEMVSTIAVSEDSKCIYLAWYTGGPDEGPGNYVTLSVSADGGKSWKHDELVVYPKDPTTRFFDPVLWKDKSGQVWLFYAVSLENPQKNILWDLKGGVNALPISWDGSKVNWEQPKLISYGVMMNKPLYVPQKDKVLFPISIWQLGKDNSGFPDYIPDGTFIHKHTYKDGKEKLDYLKEYSSINILPDSMRTYDEHQVVQVNDKGDMLCLVRVRGGIYYSKSRDYGKSWTVLQPFTMVGPTTSSRFYIGKLRSGNLILVLNNSKKRTNMTAFLSKDGGKTWPHKLLLDDRNNVSYPDIDEDKNGVIHVTWDRERKGAKEINYARITEEDIIASEKREIFKTRVNQP